MSPMEFAWHCEGCKSVVRFTEAVPMENFAQGILSGLELARHAKECKGHHFEKDHEGVSLQDVILALRSEKTYEELVAWKKGA